MKPPAYAKFMSEGWVPSDLEDVVAGPAVTSAFVRRAALSAQYPGIRLILPAGEGVLSRAALTGSFAGEFTSF